MHALGNALRSAPLRDSLKSDLHRRFRVDRTVSVSLGRFTKPNFVIIGAQKAGTTSLYSYLTRHPDIKPALRKEVHFFDLHYSRGLNWYLGHFPTSRSQYYITGEATPYYLFHPDAPRRMHDLLPEAKIIVILRNPVARAYSHYNHALKLGLEDLSFADAVARELRLARSHSPPILDLTDPYLHQHNSYISRGLYSVQLERWLAYYPREQFLVLKSEHLFSDPATSVTQSIDFLGLRPEGRSAQGFTAMNANAYSHEIPADTNERLLQLFEPYNERLSTLVDIDVSDWTEPVQDLDS
ncbi:sulfotransferase domain-containing protein [Mycolicibacterium palauense]|uniref:sulfotransferase domain-containing protein n=1 Tax=Mycolicibacterium palauense TaxID=2034511 RepID=UPI000BFF0F72